MTDNVYFDVSNVRGFAENLHHKYHNEYKAEIARIKVQLRGGATGGRTDGAADKPMGNVDADYYGRDIAETQTENVAAFIQWLDSVEASILATINAGLYMADEMDNSDGATAANIDLFFEKSTFEDMNFLDPASDYPGR